MESGLSKAVTKLQTIKIGYLLAISFLIFCLGIGILFRMEYKNYSDKMNILYRMLSDNREDENVTEATRILKGEELTAGAEGKKRLEQYGYRENYTNALKKSFYLHCLYEFLIFFILYVWLLCLFYLLRRKNYRRTDRILQEVSTSIHVLRNGSYALEKNDSDLSLKDSGAGRLRQELDSLASYLEQITMQAEQEKEETKILVTDLSHQLKTPVSALKASFDILSSGGLNQEEREEFFQRCQQQIERLEELLAALLQISRMETGMITLHFEECRIQDTILQSVNRIYPNAQEKGVEIIFLPEGDSEKTEEIVIRQDVKWLSEALINLLENAVKYSGTGTEIKVRLSKTVSFLRIEIEDQGIGIPKGERHKVFQRFYRGGSDQVQNQSGSGVGLYLARKIIEQHFGTIKVKFADEKQQTGSIFVVQLPLEKFGH